MAPHYALVAQGIEHRSPKAGVGGSNPSEGTTNSQVNRSVSVGLLFVGVLGEGILCHQEQPRSHPMTEEEPLRQPLQEIALVDNKALASFIIGYGVGVSTVEAYEVKNPRSRLLHGKAGFRFCRLQR